MSAQIRSTGRAGRTGRPPGPTGRPPGAEVPRTLEELAEQVRVCARCASMAGRRRVPGQGRPLAALLFVAEAPGRLGADRTGAPLRGDRAGDLFWRMAEAVGIADLPLYVTNTVKCNPRDAHGRNRPPSRPEVAACADHLGLEIALVRPTLVVAMGAVACRAVTGLALREALGRLVRGPGAPAFVLHHPGYVVRHLRAESAYLADWRALRRALDGVRPDGGGAGAGQTIAGEVMCGVADDAVPARRAARFPAPAR